MGKIRWRKEKGRGNSVSVIKLELRNEHRIWCTVSGGKLRGAIRESLRGKNEEERAARVSRFLPLTVRERKDVFGRPRRRSPLENPSWKSHPVFCLVLSVLRPRKVANSVSSRARPRTITRPSIKNARIIVAISIAMLLHCGDSAPRNLSGINRMSVVRPVVYISACRRYFDRRKPRKFFSVASDRRRNRKSQKWLLFFSQAENETNLNMDRDFS